MDSGDVWAYRKRGHDPLEPVAFLRGGRGKQAKRVLVRFLDEDWDGYEEWVPERRLKVPWSQVEELRDQEARWAAVSAVARPASDAQAMAIGMAVDALLEPGALDFNISGPNAGVSRVFDIDHVAGRSGVSADEIRAHRLSFSEHDYFVVPWSTSRLIVESLAALQPARLLIEVETLEDELLARRRGRAFPSPDEEKYLRRHEDETRAVLTYFREWAGADAADQWQSLIDARAEIERLTQLLDLTIEKLEKYGHEASAKTVRGYRDGRQLPANLKKRRPE
jgi:hypothetical protein